MIVYHASNLQALQMKNQLKSSFPGMIKTAIGIHPEVYLPSSDFMKTYNDFDSARKILLKYEKLVEKAIFLLQYVLNFTYCLITI